MAFLFRSKPTKVESVKLTKDLLLKLWQPPQTAKSEEDLGKLLGHMKLTLQGTHDVDSSPEVVEQLITEMIKEDFFYHLARSMHLLRFEARKDSQTILSYALRFKPYNKNQAVSDDESPAVAHVIDQRPEVVIRLCRGYEHRDSAMSCGTVLREILKNEHITAIILYDESKIMPNGPDGTETEEPAVRVDDLNLSQPQTGQGIFWQFFGWIENATFEASTDAFSTFRELLTRHKSLVAQYLSINFDIFFSQFNSILIQSNSYVTKRQSIKLLGEILLERTNYNVMNTYVSRGDHLKLCMNLLKSDRKMVQYEAFHVFKVFVANPCKSEAIIKILTQNRDRLLRFLTGFLDDRQDDDQFLDEKSFLIQSIGAMATSASTSASASTTTLVSGPSSSTTTLVSEAESTTTLVP